jgi:hypothetical protein
MKCTLVVFLSAAVLRAASGDAAANQLTPAEMQEGYRLLFNGRNLDGWDGDPTLWSISDGAIVGCSDGRPFKVNTFLIHEATVRNFILKADVKLRNNNGGINFRSEQIPGPNWIVKGWQAGVSEMGDEKSGWGNFYEERGRGRTMMKTPDQGWLIAKSVVHHGDWNSYEILADGEHVRLVLNGVVTIDTHETGPGSGIIALLLHNGEPMRVGFRNLKLKILP